MAKGNTLEELAASMEKNLGVPAAATLVIIGRYNGFCAAGADEDFGKDTHHLTPSTSRRSMSVPPRPAAHSTPTVAWRSTRTRR